MKLRHLLVAAAAALVVSVPLAAAFDGPRATVYFLHGETLRATDREVAGEGLQGHIEVLFAGPTAQQRAQGLTSAVPRGTKVRSVWIQNGTATIDVANRFQSGGGSLSMTARLAQLVYTATALDGVKRVELKLNGKKVEAIGGEGILVDTPRTRAHFARLLPKLALETPAQGATLKRGRVTVKGTAQTRSSSFTLVLTDGDGLIAARKVVRVEAGARVPFSATLAFAPEKPGWGAVIAYEGTAGRQQNLVEIPVRVG